MIILFDLDGTLIDSTEAILESFSVAFKSMKHPIPNDEKIKSLIGLPLDIMFVKLGIAEEKRWDYVDAYKEHYRKISREKTKLLPFAKEAILKASKIAKLGIVTTKTSKYSAELLEHFEVLNYFKILIGREDVKHPKPHPEPILTALKKMKAKNEKVYMIGDTCFDCISAKEAKVNSIGVCGGYGCENDLNECCKMVCDNTLQAVEKIKETIC